MENRGLEVGASLVVFKEKRENHPSWSRSGGGERIGGGGRSKQEPGGFVGQHFGWKERKQGVCTLSHHLWCFPKALSFPTPEAERRK